MIDLRWIAVSFVLGCAWAIRLLQNWDAGHDAERRKKGMGA